MHLTTVPFVLLLFLGWSSYEILLRKSEHKSEHRKRNMRAIGRTLETQRVSEVIEKSRGDQQGRYLEIRCSIRLSYGPSPNELITTDYRGNGNRENMRASVTAV